MRVIFTDKEMQNLLVAHLIQVRRPAWRSSAHGAGDLGKPTHWLNVEAGDYLWVAEGFTVTEVEGHEAKGFYKADRFPFKITAGWLPKALSSRRARQNHTMPVEASRFTLEVYDSRVELDTAILSCRVISRNISELKKRKAAA